MAFRKFIPERLQFLFPALFFIPQLIFAQKAVHYDLFVKDTIVSYAGKNKKAIAVNGQIPMPTLEFTEGDTAEITVHNLLKKKHFTSLAWRVCS